MSNIRKSFNFRNGLQVDDTKFIINSNGLVGIGSTIPTQSLDVGDNVKVHGTIETEYLTVNNTTTIPTANSNKIIVGVTSITSGIITATSSSGIVTYYGDGGNLINLPTSQWIDVNTGFGYTSIYAAGFVGVGTVDPRFVFQVAGNTDTSAEGFTGVGIQTGGHILAAGIVTAYEFSGFGTNITGINASNISNGTLSNSRLPSDIDVSNINLSGIATAYEFSGFGTNITGINASNISNGTLDNDRLPEDVNLTGIITAYSFSGFGTDISGINASNISNGTLSNSRLASTVTVDNVVSTFTGDLTGTATTASSLSGTPNIEVGIITASNLNLTGTVYGATRIGIGTNTSSSELQIKTESGSLLEVISDIGQARVSIGNSVGVGNSSAVLIYGNTDRTFDIVNYDTGDINTIIHGYTGDVGIGSTGNFKWSYGQTNSELMTLTYGGNLGIGKTEPSENLHVGNNARIEGSLQVDTNLTVDGTITGDINYPDVIENSNIYATSGVTTVASLIVSGSADFSDATFVEATTVGIGTTIPGSHTGPLGPYNVGLTVDNTLKTNIMVVDDLIHMPTGVVTAATVSARFNSSNSSDTAVSIEVLTSPNRIVFSVAGIGSTALNLY